METKKLTASGVKTWTVEAATSVEQLMDVFFIAASALKTQSLASPILENMVNLKSRIDALADQINGLQGDVAIQRK